MYSTTGDLERRFSPAFLLATADDDGDMAPDTLVMEQAIADADAEIDHALSRRYDVPFSGGVPLIIGVVSSVLAARNLARRNPQAAVETWRGDFADAEQILTGLASGVLVLAGRTPVPRPLESLRDASERVFGREDLDGF